MSVIAISASVILTFDSWLIMAFNMILLRMKKMHLMVWLSLCKQKIMKFDYCDLDLAPMTLVFIGLILSSWTISLLSMKTIHYMVQLAICIYEYRTCSIPDLDLWYAWPWPSIGIFLKQLMVYHPVKYENLLDGSAVTVYTRIFDIWLLWPWKNDIDLQ